MAGASVCRDCGSEMEWVDCTVIGCDEGFVDAYEDDPINESPGTFEPCPECLGDGGYYLCPPCYERAYQKARADAAKRAASPAPTREEG